MLGRPKESGRSNDEILRMVTDFCQLNEITARNSYPTQLTMDIQRALFQLRSLFLLTMHPEAAHKTACARLYSTTEYIRMGMGFCNAPATFQESLDKFITGLHE